MALLDHEIKIATGRRADDARLRILIFADRLLALGVEGHGERVPTLLLTLDQARKLQDALAELITLAEAASPAENTHRVEAWQGIERRIANR